MMLRPLALLVPLMLAPLALAQESAGKTKAPPEALISEAVGIAMGGVPLEGADEAAVRACYTEALALLPAKLLGIMVDANFNPPPEIAAQIQARADFVTAMLDCAAMLPQMRSVEVIYAGNNDRFVVQAQDASAFPSYAGGISYNDGRFNIAGTDIALPAFKLRLRITVQADGSYEFIVDPLS